MDNFLRCGETCASCRKISDPPPKRNLTLLSCNVLFLLLATSLTLLWIGWWQAMDENDRLNMLEFVSRVTGIWFEWIKLFFGLSVATFTGLVIFLAFVTFLLHARVMRGQRASLRMHFAYLILNAFVVSCCFAFIGVLSVLYSQGLNLIKLKIIYSAPVLHLVMIVILTVLVGLLAQRLLAMRVLQSRHAVGMVLWVSLGKRILSQVDRLSRNQAESFPYLLELTAR